MKALILAGGFGTRLRPLTCTRPKQLLPLAESTLIGHILTQLQKSGVTEVILATGSNSVHLQNALGDGANYNVQLHFSIELDPLGTAGAIKHAEKLLQDESAFLVLNGDIVSDMAYNHLIQYHQQHKVLESFHL